ncbi:MAG: ABC-F family ATP-binding cassette domain-containing protein, partial [Ruminococcaceae bacterium]|nr:ABC-F family ATP-binding cassette domain-containing protein [Oscillospiraceae bacterium]
MTLLTVQNASLWFGEREIMSEVNFSVTDKSHIALIGVNGSGKTTLFKLITGEYQTDAGEVVTGKLTTIGYMEQITLDGDRSVYEETLEIFRPLMDM